MKKRIQLLHSPRRIILCISCILCTLTLLIGLLYIPIYQKEQTQRNIIKDFIEKKYKKDNLKLSDNLRYKKTESREFPNTTQNLYQNVSEQPVQPDTDSVIAGDVILVIPDIDLYKTVYTGKERETYLKQYELVTASDDMKYVNGGNYIICGHASRLYGHSLNRLKELKTNSKVYIYTQNEIEAYTVTDITFEKMNRTSKFCNQTNTKTLTIISCAKYIAKDQYIVVKAMREP